MVALDRSAEISGGVMVSVLVDRWRGDLGERPLGFDGFGSHPVDGAVDGGSSDTEEFGELSLV
jgi:hypothetical protein